MKREICAPEVPASQMVLTIITDEQLEAFADAVITKYQQTIVRLDCYSFWLRRNAGRNYPSYSALLDALLDEVLDADEKAAAFVKRYSEAF